MFRTLMLALVLATPVMAQDSATVTIPASSLTQEQREALTTKAMDSKIATYGKWVGVGKEIGEAVNSSLSAVTDNATKFADTKVGRTATYLVVWKVVGQDLLGFVIACLLLIVGIPIWAWSYRNALRNRYPIMEEKFDDKGKCVNRTYRHTFSKDYGHTNEVETNDTERFLHWVFLVAFLFFVTMVAL